MHHALKNPSNVEKRLKLGSFLNPSEVERVATYLPKLQAYVAKRNVCG